MTQDATSLDRLHDIVLPPDVAWWPLAPGWYALLVLALAVGGGWGWRAWRRRRASAYRRAALRELETLRDAPAIAELLRRTALAAAPRVEVASRSGPAWAEWLAVRCPETMPDEVRRHLESGVYRRAGAERDFTALRDYAARWITRHELEPPVAGESHH